AFGAFLDFLDLVFEAFEGLERAFVNDHVVAEQANFCAALDLAFGDHTARDLADLRDIKDLLDRGLADILFAFDGGEHAGEDRLGVIDDIVNNVVVTDLNAIALRQVAGLRVGTDVKADNDTV